MTARPEAGGGAATFAAATSGTSPDTHPLPQISRDGRTLSLDVISLGIVNKEDNHTIDSRSHRGHLTALLGFLVDLPDRITDGGWTAFDGVATSLATCLPPEPQPFGAAKSLVSIIDKHTRPIDDQLPPEHRPRLWLCELLDQEVHDRLRSTQKEMLEAATPEEQEDMKKWLANLRSLYLQLTSKYDKLPWSGKLYYGFNDPHSETLHQSERSNRNGRQGSEGRRRARSARRAEQRFEQREQETRTAMIDWQRRPIVSPEAREYQAATLREMQFFKKLFATTDGLVGIGPSWLKPKDRLMLVQGAAVPYLFRHVSDVDLSKIIRQARVSLQKVEAKIARSHAKDRAKATEAAQSGVKESQATHELKKKASGLRAKIAEHELHVGRDAWFLVGEVYVDGIMHGEAMARAGVDAFERISVV